MIYPLISVPQVRVGWYVYMYGLLDWSTVDMNFLSEAFGGARIGGVFFHLTEQMAPLFDESWEILNRLTNEINRERQKMNRGRPW